MAQTWLEKYSTYEEEVTGAMTGITAYAGGGQANATQLTAKFNNVTVSGTNGDSVKLPTAIVGKMVIVCNSDATQTIAVFPQTGEYMNGTINASSTISPAMAEVNIFICPFDGYWFAIGN